MRSMKYRRNYQNPGINANKVRRARYRSAATATAAAAATAAATAEVSAQAGGHRTTGAVHGRSGLPGAQHARAGQVR
jgi:hypothetical protein